MAAFAIPAAEAARLKVGYYACTSKEVLREVGMAKGDQMRWLLDNGCIVTRGGIKVHDVGRDGRFVRKVRVILSDGTVLYLWTPVESALND